MSKRQIIIGTIRRLLLGAGSESGLTGERGAQIGRELDHQLKLIEELRVDHARLSAFSSSTSGAQSEMGGRITDLEVVLESKLAARKERDMPADPSTQPIPVREREDPVCEGAGQPAIISTTESAQKHTCQHCGAWCILKLGRGSIMRHHTRLPTPAEIQQNRAESAPAVERRCTSGTSARTAALALKRQKHER